MAQIRSFTNNLSSYTLTGRTWTPLKKELVSAGFGEIFGLASNFKGCESHRGLGAEDLCCCSLKETTHGVGLPTARLAKPQMSVWTNIIQKIENFTFIFLTASKWHVAFVYIYYLFIFIHSYIHTYIYIYDILKDQTPLDFALVFFSTTKKKRWKHSFFFQNLTFWKRQKNFAEKKKHKHPEKHEKACHLST